MDTNIIIFHVSIESDQVIHHANGHTKSTPRWQKGNLIIIS